VTEEWLGLIDSDDKPEQIRFATIPNVLPSEKNRGSDMPSFVAATQTRMEEPFERLLNRLDGEPPHAIISDAFLIWTIRVGNRRNIPVALLWPMPASVFSIFHHFDLLVEKGYKPGKISESGETRVDFFPGIPSIRLRDLPSILQMKDQSLAESVLKILRQVSDASYLLLSSIDAIESRVIGELSREFGFPVAAIGTTIPFLDLPRATARFTPDQDDDDDYVNWLISQPPSSVLYVAFGSFLPVSSPQMDAIADGLRRSGVRFLWAARGEAARLRERCGGERGRIVPWCEQLKVLSQPSVGGFWSHCGWNSTMEAILCGVPVIAMPLIMDQLTVRKHVVEDWRIGVDAMRGVAPGEMLRSGQVEELVKEFMDLESPERKEMELRAAELRAATVEEFSDGGSSRRNLRHFVE
ncbi:hypothetical protein M569_10096, partial [Genlisea aurea]